MVTLTQSKNIVCLLAFNKMGNSNSNLVHPRRPIKAFKGFDGLIVKSAEDNLRIAKTDHQPKSSDKLKMMPNIQNTSSAPFILDNQREYSSHEDGSKEDIRNSQSFIDQTTEIPFVTNVPQQIHSVEILMPEDNSKDNPSVSHASNSTSPVVFTDNVITIITRTGSLKNELGTPILKKTIGQVIPITPLMEVSAENAGVSENTTTSYSLEVSKFESLVDSNVPSYGSVDWSIDENDLYSSFSISRQTQECTNMDMRKESFSCRSTTDMLKLISDDDDMDRKNKLLAKRRNLQKSLIKYNSCSTIYPNGLFAFSGIKDILHRYF